MKTHLRLLTAALVIFISGCATAPQTPVALSNSAITNNQRIGIAMTALPKIETQFPGADCLLCLAAASIANSSLTKHTQTLTYDTLPTIKQQLAVLLKKKGADVFVIDEALNVKDLKSSGAQGDKVATKDFSSFKQKYNINKLVVIEINSLGFVRTYASYIPTSDPKGTLQGVGYMVNLADNTYDWYLPVAITKSAESNWDEPTAFPGLTNAYFQAMEIGKDSFLSPFSGNIVTSTIEPTVSK